MTAGSSSTEEEKRKPHRLSAAWLSLLIPVVALGVAFLGAAAHLGDQSVETLLLFCVIGCGAGCVSAVIGLSDTKRRRRWLSVLISIVGLLLNVAVALGLVFAYAMANAWKDVKG